MILFLIANCLCPAQKGFPCGRTELFDTLYSCIVNFKGTHAASRSATKYHKVPGWSVPLPFVVDMPSHKRSHPLHTSTLRFLFCYLAACFTKHYSRACLLPMAASTDLGHFRASEPFVRYKIPSKAPSILALIKNTTSL